jgi:hypothetical protein
MPNVIVDVGIMSLGVINHGMSLSVQSNFEKTMFVQA